MKLNKLPAALLSVLLIFAMLLPAQMFASDERTTASLTVSYAERQGPIASAEFDVYRVAEPAGEGYALVGDFKKVAVSLEKTDVESLSKLASTLDIYTDLYNIAPTASAATDSDGKATFGDLPFGLYLVLGRDLIRDGKKYVNTPFVVFLPDLDEQGERIYDVTVLPKFETEPEKPGEDITVCKALKVWQSDIKNDRPKTITVYLLRDGEVYETVTLSSENNWRYSWSGLDSAYKWTVAEKVPEDYTVTIQKQGVTYLVTNSGDTTPPPEEGDKDKDKDKPGSNLPQTGQLWWPVPFLCALGLILILIGCIRRRGDADEA